MVNKYSGEYVELLKEIVSVGKIDASDCDIDVIKANIDGREVIVAEIPGATMEDISVSVNEKNISGMEFYDIKIKANYIAAFGLISKKIDVSIRETKKIEVIETELNNGLLIIKYDYFKK